MKGKKFINGEWVDWVYDDSEHGTLSFIQDKELDELIPYAVVLMFALDNIHGAYWLNCENDEYWKDTRFPIPEICFISTVLGIVMTRIVELSNGRLGVCWGKSKFDGSRIASGISVTDNNGTTIVRSCLVSSVWEKLVEFMNEAKNESDIKTWLGAIWFIVDNHGQEICDMVYEALDWKV